MNYHTNNSHVESATLLVKNLAKMTNFYTQIIGLKQISQAENQVNLGAGNKILLTLKTHKNVTLKQTPTQGLYHIAFLLPTRENLARILYNLMIKQVELQGLSDHGVSEAIYLADPENNGIELYVDRVREEWPLNENGEIEMFTERLNYVSLLSTVKTPGFNGFDDEAILGHLHLNVSEIKNPTNFFVNLLNFEIQQNLYDTALFVSTNNYHHHIAFNTWSYFAPLQEENQTGLISYKIKTNKESLEKIVSKLTLANYEFKIENNMLTTKDTNNTTVEIYY